jgi:hypothetical protein
MKNTFIKLFFTAYIITLCFFNLSIAQTCNWARQAVGNDWSIAYQVTHDLNNNLYACGFFIDSARFGNVDEYADSQTGFVVKYDATGNFIWVKTLPTGQGWTDDSFIEQISCDPENNIIIYGHFRGTINAGNTQLTAINENIFLIKMDENGDVIWARQTNEPSTDFRTFIMTTDLNNNIYIGGNTSFPSNFGGFAATGPGSFIVRYDSSGVPNLLINELRCDISSINVGINNNIFITGTLNDTSVIGNDSLIPSGYYDYIFFPDTDTVYNQPPDLLFVCYDSTGNVIWHRQAISTTEEFSTFSSLDENSNLYVSGIVSDTTDFWGTPYSPASQVLHSYAIKIDSAGNLIWNKFSESSSGNGYLIPSAVEVKDNRLYLAGVKHDTCTFMNFTVSSPNTLSYILYCDTAGNALRDVFDSTNTWINKIFEITIDHANNIGICGYFEDSLAFCNDHLSAFGNTWPLMFVASTTSSPLGVHENISYDQNDVIIFPNPGHGDFSILTEKRIDQLRVFDSTGRLVREINENAKGAPIRMTLNQPGLYFITLLSGNSLIIKKIVVN